jgi:MFS family permease
MAFKPVPGRPEVRRVIASHAFAAVGMGLPWPALLLAVEESTTSQLVLGLAGAARLAPYVALSWLSGRLADRRERALIVRISLLARLFCLLAAAAALAASSPMLAVLAATGAIVAGTPAYPALAAGMPRLAGAATERATSLLVTVEVASFVVGPALGGAMVGRVPAAWVPIIGAVLVGVSILSFARISMPAPPPLGPDADGCGVWTLLRREASARHALAVVAVVNALLSVLGLLLLQLAHDVWRSGDEGFGLATAVLGFGALGAPALAHTRAMRSGRACLLTLAGAAAAFAVLPGGPASLGALAAIGAVAVCCENVATAVLQTTVPDELRASVLGLADTVMVGAALIAALATPWLGVRLGPATLVLLVAAGAGLLALAWGTDRLPTDPDPVRSSLAVPTRQTPDGSDSAGPPTGYPQVSNARVSASRSSAVTVSR